MRILYHHRTLADGAEGIHIREMIHALRELGHEVRVCALVGERSQCNAGHTRAANKWARIGRLLPGFAYEIAELGYNIVGRRVLAANLRAFSPDFIYDRYNSYSTAASTVAHRAGIPLLLEVNAPIALERTEFDGPRLSWPRLAARFERHICGMASHIFAVSSPLRDFLVTQRDVAIDKITVLPNGADPNAFDPHLDGTMVRNRFGFKDRTVIGFVGILRPWHGIELLFDAFSKLNPDGNNLHLLFVGDGPIEADLRSQTRALGLADRVTFAGRVAHQDVAACIAAMDIAVSPRATFYASPMKILEYMAMGIPVVAPRMPNILDICRDGIDAVLFEPENAESLEHAIRHILGDRSLAERIGAAARATIDSRLNWKRNAEAVIECASRLLRGKVSDAPNANVRRPWPG